MCHSLYENEIYLAYKEVNSSVHTIVLCTASSWWMSTSHQKLLVFIAWRLISTFSFLSKDVFIIGIRLLFYFCIRNRGFNQRLKSFWWEKYPYWFFPHIYFQSVTITKGRSLNSVPNTLKKTRTRQVLSLHKTTTWVYFSNIFLFGGNFGYRNATWSFYNMLYM